MGDKSLIEWCDATWNPVTGCNKVSAGCKYCYAERGWSRLSGNADSVYAGRDFSDVKCHADRLLKPLEWKRPRIIFVNSMSDLFHESVPFSFIASVFSTIANADHHVFLLLTKRSARMREFVDWYISNSVVEGIVQFESAFRHLWLGVSVEDQASVETRIPDLLRTRAAIRWVSAEPLLEDIDIAFYLDDDIAPNLRALDWVVIGGETGQQARKMEPQWVHQLLSDCRRYSVPAFFKQWGEWGESGERVGKKAAGSLVAGREYRQWPGGTRPCQ